ncbi:hypothetical protein DFH08DRAFT_825983 [Mycena albidolilacea]|uniref:Uncharacterized protein n=1 Tax=Mycena albidolilacea TaxID=1033008 RepID=A0AAD6Z1B7_9AGAR|nr:hypothetical protein DFH08DRAFT_825983 [Mycena albidolilacea]
MEILNFYPLLRLSPPHITLDLYSFKAHSTSRIDHNASSFCRIVKAATKKIEDFYDMASGTKPVPLPVWDTESEPWDTGLPYVDRGPRTESKLKVWSPGMEYGLTRLCMDIVIFTPCADQEQPAPPFRLEGLQPLILPTVVSESKSPSPLYPEMRRPCAAFNRAMWTQTPEGVNKLPTHVPARLCAPDVGEDGWKSMTKNDLPKNWPLFFDQAIRILLETRSFKNPPHSSNIREFAVATGSHRVAFRHAGPGGYVIMVAVAVAAAFLSQGSLATIFCRTSMHKAILESKI